MEPPVSSHGQFEGHLVVLDIVFAHVDIVTVGRDIVQGFALKLRRFSLCDMFPYVSGLSKFSSYPGQILFALRNGNAGKNGLEMFHSGLHVLSLDRQCFRSPLKLRISVKILHGHFLSR